MFPPLLSRRLLATFYLPVLYGIFPDFGSLHFCGFARELPLQNVGAYAALDYQFCCISAARQIIGNLLKEICTPDIQNRRITDEWLHIRFRL